MGKKSKTFSKFVKDSIKIHGDRYDYSEVNYRDAHTKIKIYCKEHGEFYQEPNSHIKGRGCPKCSGNSRKDTNSFIKEAINLNGDKYDYSKVAYINAHTKVKIICPIHGEFYQRPNGHLKGQGCPKCRKVNNTYSHSVWENLGNKSNSFDSFKVYIVELWNDKERFYKIGKTYETVGNRFRSTKIPYNWKTIKIFEGNAKYISELEDELHMKYKEHKYVPIKKFSGSTECFNISISL